MAYSKFTIRSVKERLGVQIVEDTPLFTPTQITPVTPSDYLKTTLSEYAPLALSINTEKSRSEWIIAPVLAEVRKLHQNRIGLFSGTTFVVDKAKGLDGQCDYILSLSAEQFYISAPLLAIVEAKSGEDCALKNCQSCKVCSRGSCGVLPVVPKNTPQSNAGTPKNKMLIAVPLTT